jgi:hypothetical protein
MLWFVGCVTEPQRKDDVGHASRSGDLLRRKESHARVSQSGPRTGRCVNTSGARDTIADVVSRGS